jgi:hypothetical protein
MEEYGRNNFVKKCPKCSIITEKNNGCNHITCAKCGYQWCWLCNQEYNAEHFEGGKCKGFQFFQPKNEYEIKLMIEGKINFDELSISQRQFHDNSIYSNLPSDISNTSNTSNISRLSQPHEVRIDENELYNNVKCPKKAYYVFIFVIFGNSYIILKGFNLLKNILVIMIYILLSFSLFFQMTFLNIFSLLLILIHEGFRDFILGFDELQNLYIENFIVVFVNILIGNFCFLIFSF